MTIRMRRRLIRARNYARAISFDVTVLVGFTLFIWSVLAWVR